MFIIPVLQVFFVFFAIICGGIFFQEFSNFTAGQYVGFIVGVLMILGGVYGLAPAGNVDIIKSCETDVDPSETKLSESSTASFQPETENSSFAIRPILSMAEVYESSKDESMFATEMSIETSQKAPTDFEGSNCSSKNNNRVDIHGRSTYESLVTTVVNLRSSKSNKVCDL